MPSMNHSGTALSVGAENVVLKRVHELVANHVVGVGQRGAERQHDAALHAFGHAAGALADHRIDDVGLLEVGMAGVEDQRLAARELMREELRSRAYQRSAMRPAVRAAASSAG